MRLEKRMQKHEGFDGTKVRVRCRLALDVREQGEEAQGMLAYELARLRQAIVVRGSADDEDQHSPVNRRTTRRGPR